MSTPRTTFKSKEEILNCIIYIRRICGNSTDVKDHLKNELLMLIFKYFHYPMHPKCNAFMDEKERMEEYEIMTQWRDKRHVPPEKCFVTYTCQGKTEHVFCPDFESISELPNDAVHIFMEDDGMFYATKDDGEKIPVHPLPKATASLPPTSELGGKKHKRKIICCDLHPMPERVQKELGYYNTKNCGCNCIHGCAYTRE